MPIPRMTPEDREIEKKERFMEYACRLSERDLERLFLFWRFALWRSGHGEPDTTKWMLVQGAWWGLFRICYGNVKLFWTLSRSREPHERKARS
jgi:hypothetical protein